NAPGQLAAERGPLLQQANAGRERGLELLGLVAQEGLGSPGVTDMTAERAVARCRLPQGSTAVGAGKHRQLTRPPVGFLLPEILGDHLTVAIFGICHGLLLLRRWRGERQARQVTANL